MIAACTRTASIGFDPGEDETGHRTRQKHEPDRLCRFDPRGECGLDAHSAHKACQPLGRTGRAQAWLPLRDLSQQSSSATRRAATTVPPSELPIIIPPSGTIARASIGKIPSPKITPIVTTVAAIEGRHRDREQARGFRGRGCAPSMPQIPPSPATHSHEKAVLRPGSSNQARHEAHHDQLGKRTDHGPDRSRSSLQLLAE